MANEVEFFTSVLTAALRLATPLLLASLGEIISQKSGVLNMGLEGIMATSAFIAFTVTFFTGHGWLGILSALGTGALFGILHAFVSIRIKVNQVVMGFSIAIFGVGLGGFLYRAIFGVQTVPPQVPDYIHLRVIYPGIQNVPVIGSILLGQGYLLFLAVALVL